MSQIFVESASNTHNASHRSSLPAPGMLDFLYPRKTLTLLKKLSLGKVEGNRAHSGATKARHYSSKSIQRTSVLTSVNRVVHNGSIRAGSSSATARVELDDTAVLKNHLQNLEWIDARQGKAAIDELNPAKVKFLELVKGHIPERYNDLKDSDQTTDAKILLANFLSFSSRENDSIRLLFLTNGNDFETTFAVWRAIVIRLFAGDLEKAAEIHEAAQRQSIQTYIGSDVLLAHAIQAENWKLALRISTTVFNTLQRPYDKTIVQQAVHNLWEVTTRLPNLLDLVSTFLAFAYERLDLQYFVIKAFVTHFLLATLSSMPQSAEPVRKFLEEIQIYRIDEKPLIQFALEKILHTTSKPGYILDTELYSYLATIWSAYRKFCEQGDVNIPLIHNLLRLFTRDGSTQAATEEQERALILDILSTCATKQAALPYHIMVSVITMYAWRGNTETVRYLNSILSPRFGELSSMQRSEEDQRQDAVRAYALIRVHILRGEDKEAEQVFTRLREVYPEITQRQEPWQALVKLYGRARRFGKMFDVLFNRMPEAGSPPSSETLQIVLREFGRQGNIPAVSSLLTLAKSNGIALTIEMVKHLVTAHIRNGDPEEAEAIAMMIQESQDVPGQLVGSSYLVSKLYSAARNNDVNAATGIYRRIMTSDTKVDRFAFARVVDLLTKNKRTDEAFKVAFVDMPAKHLSCGANIYAMLIRGFWHEHRYTEAIDTFDQMTYAGESPTVNACNYWISALCQMCRPRPRLDRDVLQGLRALVSGQFSNVTWEKDWPPTWHQNRYDVYFASLIERFAEVHAWDVINCLQKWYKQLQSTDPPLAVIKALMKANNLAGNHDEVDKLFNMGFMQLSSDIRRMANDLTSLSIIKDSPFQTISSQRLWTGSDTQGHFNLLSEESDKPLQQDDSDGSSTASDIRHLIEKLLLDYMSSLVAQRRFDDMIQTMVRLQSLGFTMDKSGSHRIWNHYVQSLCKSSEPRHLVTAFRTAEIRLFSKHALFRKDIADNPELRVTMTRDKAIKRDEIRVEPRTMVTLKEMGLAADQTSVNSASLGIAQNEEVLGSDTVTLSSVLQQVAPRMLPAVMAWNGNQFVRGHRRHDYFKTPMQLLAMKGRQLRDLWWTKASQEEVEERLVALGPSDRLEPFTELTEPYTKALENTDNSIPLLDLGERSKRQIVSAEEVLRTLETQHEAKKSRERSPWEESLYVTVEEGRAESTAQENEKLVDLGYDPALEQNEDAPEQEDERGEQREVDLRYNPEKLFASLRERTEAKKGERFWKK